MGPQGCLGAGLVSMQGRSKAGMAAHPCEVKSVPVASWLVQDWGAGNKDLLFQNSGFYSTINRNHQAANLIPTSKIIFHVMQKGMGELLFPNVQLVHTQEGIGQVNGQLALWRCQNHSSVPCPMGPTSLLNEFAQLFPSPNHWSSQHLPLWTCSA